MTSNSAEQIPADRKTARYASMAGTPRWSHGDHYAVNDPALQDTAPCHGTD